MYPTGLLRILNFKLSDRAPPDKVALAEGGTVLFETRSVDTVGGTTAFEFDPTGNRDHFGPSAGKKRTFCAIFSTHKYTSDASFGNSFIVTKFLVIVASCFFYS